MPSDIATGANDAEQKKDCVERDQLVRSNEFPLSMTWVIVVGLTVGGGALRYLGCLNNLWLDELISLHSASSIQSVWQVFTSIHSDNNHYLNSIYLFLLGGHSYSAAARFFSLACGIASIPSAYWAGRTQSLKTAYVYALLMTFSYPAIHFSSEARGYSAEMLAGIVSYGAVVRCLKGDDRKRWVLVFLVAAVLGLLSHLTFVFVLVAYAVWTWLELTSAGWRTWLALHPPWAMLVAVLWFVDLRHAGIFGGEVTRSFVILSRLIANVLGWPRQDTWSVWLVGVPVLALALWVVTKLKRAGRPVWVFWLLMIGLPPLILAGIRFMNPQAYLSLRYLLAFVPFWLLLLAISLEPFRRPLVIALLGLFLAGNTALVARFLMVGRGQYPSALTFISRNTAGPVISVTSNSDFRAGVELDYYQRVLPANQRLHYITYQNLNSEVPEWVILHGDALDPPNPETISFSGRTWKKAAYYGTAELSGQAWTIYHLEPQ